MHFLKNVFGHLLKRSWQFYVSWTVCSVGIIAPLALGLLDFESLNQNNWVGYVVGSIAIIINIGLNIWGIKTLSIHQSLGLKGKLITQGLYRYSCNPQYLGVIVMNIGVVLLTFSIMALIAEIIITITFLILPFSEEPWLKQQYGEAYLQYKEKVPRFIL